MARLILLRELAAGECLAEGPSGGRDVVGDNGAAVAGGDPEGERLPVEARAALPVLAPVPGHAPPPRPPGAAPHGHRNGTDELKA